MLVTYLFCMVLASGNPFCVPIPEGVEACYQLKQETEEAYWRQDKPVPKLYCKLPDVYTLRRGQFVDLKKEYNANAN